MENVLYVVCLVGVLTWAWPALKLRDRRTLGVMLAVLAPLSWAWLLVVGYRERAERDRSPRLGLAERVRLADDVAFWRGRYATGSPLEREVARGYLESIGYDVVPGPGEVVAAASRPDGVVTLVVKDAAGRRQLWFTQQPGGESRTRGAATAPTAGPEGRR